MTTMTNSAHANENITSATYDATDQLTGVDYNALADEGYTYDDAGNRVTVNTTTSYTTGTGVLGQRVFTTDEEKRGFPRKMGEESDKNP